METAAALAADLRALTDIFGAGEPDIARTVLRLIAEVRRTVKSYLGLSLGFAVPDPILEFTTLSGCVQPGDVHASLQIPLNSAGGHGPASRVTLVLYAAAAGAFVDLAADLAWMTDADLDSLVVDEHLSPPRPGRFREALEARSTIDQAIGVLIGRGYTPAAARRELDAHSTGEASREVRAAEILGTLELGTADPPSA